MSLNVKSAFMILFLISLAIPKFEGRENPCHDYAFVNPPPETSKKAFSIKNNTEVECAWFGSNIDYVADFELFTSDENIIGILWNDTVKMKDHSASAKIRIYVPSDTKLPATFFGRSWANTSGPDCFTLTNMFTIKPE